MSKDKSTRTNRQIRTPEVRLIGLNGEQVGIVRIQEALGSAEDAGLDLVEISPNAAPPVCRIMDYGKFLFEQNKKRHAQKKKQHQVQIKEVKFRPTTDVGDYNVKLKKIMTFLDRGDKVKITLRFKGREIQHRNLGVELLERVMGELKELAVIEQQPKMEGRQVVMVVVPHKQ